MENEVSDSLSISCKGKYAEIIVTRDEQFWRMIVDEKNLAKFIFSAQQVLQEMKTGKTEF
jgi:hypothetical protein